MTRAILLAAIATSGACFSTPSFSMPDASSTDAAGDATQAMNYMFVTSGKVTGNRVIDVTFADGFCQSAADAVPLAGTYHAWVSFTAGTSAAARFGTARGWIRRDGQPFADKLGDIATGNFYAPPRIDERGKDAVQDFEYVLTGTLASGASSGTDCGSSGNGTVGLDDAAAPLWTEYAPLNCSTDLHLYCFGIDHSTPLVVAKDRRPLAFVSRLTPVTSGGSAASFDAVCQQDATTKGLSGTFVAAVATTSQSAWQRIGGSQGTQWYRSDGTIAAIASAASFVAPLDHDVFGTRTTDEVFFGASSLTTLADPALNCSDWSSNSGGLMTSTGDTRRSTEASFHGSSNVQCAVTKRVYCFEMQ